MDIHSQISYKGYNINIYYDENPMNPRTDIENLGTIYTAHRRYRPEEEFDKHFNKNEVFDGRLGNFSDSFLQKYVALPIYLYDHSGITISTSPFSCPWDSGFYGIIAVSLEKVRQEYGWKSVTRQRREQIKKYLQGEINELDDYYTGQVFRYELIEVNTEEKIDSCSGFFGTGGKEEIESECRAMIDHLLAAKKQEHFRYLMNKFKRGVQLCIPFSAYPNIDLAID